MNDVLLPLAVTLSIYSTVMGIYGRMQLRRLRKEHDRAHPHD